MVEADVSEWAASVVENDRRLGTLPADLPQWTLRRDCPDAPGAPAGRRREAGCQEAAERGTTAAGARAHRAERVRVAEEQRLAAERKQLEEQQRQETRRRKEEQQHLEARRQQEQERLGREHQRIAEAERRSAKRKQQDEHRGRPS